ncbi:hypothetical protein F5Y17DRAFT_412725 [Xylariaceae sp. FL0594]|nr:hypothetical protein F5Y17DRAFT_412725 [Xylariaceae sp. FL0594]
MSPANIAGHTGEPEEHRTQFLGSQVGGESVINYSYTDLPWKLVAWDIKLFFKLAWALPWIIWPLRPCDGGHFDELSPTSDNIWCIAVHCVLAVLQLLFIIALPVALVLPVYLFVVALVVFFTVNWLLCLLLNGDTITYESDPKYAPALEEHKHEQWIFLNGVAVGEAWLKSNINRLALTFRRPVIGIHNRTTGIIFDVVECLIQRNFGYATKDVRQAYKIVKEKLYNPQYTKVIFILHSQGGIEGGLVLDWLLQELPQDLLAKLEVYTFGNASNHFNNPHRHVRSQQEERAHPNDRTELEQIDSDLPITDSPVEAEAPSLHRQSTHGSTSSAPRHPKSLKLITQGGRTLQRRRTYTIPSCDRALGHVEHYAHTTDFVALWGLLHFVTNECASPEMPRFIGRVFRRVSARGGHQFSQHYLNGMFPLERDAASGEFTGCADENDFMDSVVEVAGKGTEKEDLREGFENSWAMLERAGAEPDSSDTPPLVAVHGSFHGSFHNSPREPFDGTVRVKHLSRLWQYRNGRSPPDVVKSWTR